MAGEESLQSLLVRIRIVLNVCITGSRGWPLPVTLSRWVPSEEDSGTAEALRGRVSVPGRAQLVIQYIQGVLAVHSSDLDKAHHAKSSAGNRHPATAQMLSLIHI